MRSTGVVDRDDVMAVLERFRTVVGELCDLPLDALPMADLGEVLDTIETGRCQLPVIEHQAISQIVAQATPEQSASR